MSAVPKSLFLSPSLLRRHWVDMLPHSSCGVGSTAWQPGEQPCREHSCCLVHTYYPTCRQTVAGDTLLARAWRSQPRSVPRRLYPPPGVTLAQLSNPPCLSHSRLALAKALEVDTSHHDSSLDVRAFQCVLNNHEIEFCNGRDGISRLL